MKAGALRLQVIRFGIVGLTSNLVLYLLYLGLTAIEVEPKLAMSLVYVVGVVQTFVFNKNWTFKHHGRLSATFVRYVGVYLAGYLINLGALIVAVDQFGYPHQWVQGVMILVLAVFLFVMQRVCVFQPAKAT